MAAAPRSRSRSRDLGVHFEDPESTSRPVHPNAPGSSSTDNPNLPIWQQGSSSSPYVPDLQATDGTYIPVPRARRSYEDDDNDTDATEYYPDDEEDLIVFEEQLYWQLLTYDHRICENTGSFSVPTDINCDLVDLGASKLI